MDSASPSWIEILANLNTVWIIGIAAVLTVLRINLLKTKSPSTRSFGELVESCLIAIVLVFMIIRPFIVQAYFIPSASMEPTLLGKNGSGDRIIVNKMSYRFGVPQRGDVVVFIPPDSGVNSHDENSPIPVNFIKRLVAKPGDTLEAVAGYINIGTRAFSHNAIRTAFAQNGAFPEYNGETPPDIQADHHVKFAADGVYLDGARLSKDRLLTLLRMPANTPVDIHPGYTKINGQILSEPYTAEDPDYDLHLYNGEPLKFDHANNGQPFKYAGAYITPQDYQNDLKNANNVVPPGTFFMMGDNRNDSDDSTEWGPLKKERVVGKAQFIFWPLNRLRHISSSN